VEPSVEDKRWQLYFHDEIYITGMRMHGLLDIPCITKHSCSWKRLAVIWGSCMTGPFLSTANRNCPVRRFLRKKNSLGMGVSRERKCLLNIVSQKLISYDFCTSFVLHKVKWAFGGSKWKLRSLHV